MWVTLDSEMHKWIEMTESRIMKRTCALQNTQEGHAMHYNEILKIQNLGPIIKSKEINE